MYVLTNRNSQLNIIFKGQFSITKNIAVITKSLLRKYVLFKYYIFSFLLIDDESFEITFICSGQRIRTNTNRRLAFRSHVNAKWGCLEKHERTLKPGKIRLIIVDNSNSKIRVFVLLEIFSNVRKTVPKSS